MNLASPFSAGRMLSRDLDPFLRPVRACGALRCQAKTLDPWIGGFQKRPYLNPRNPGSGKYPGTSSCSISLTVRRRGRSGPVR